MDEAHGPESVSSTGAGSPSEQGPIRPVDQYLAWHLAQRSCSNTWKRNEKGKWPPAERSEGLCDLHRTKTGVTWEVLGHGGAAGAGKLMEPAGTGCGGFQLASANILSSASLHCPGTVPAVCPRSKHRWAVSKFFHLSGPSFLVYKIARVGTQVRLRTISLLC